MKRGSFFKMLAGGLAFFGIRSEILFSGSLKEKPKNFNEAVVNKLIKAFADEWLAYYQYYVEYNVIKGKFKEKAIPELKEHAEDELRHAGMLAERIKELGGTIILSPKEWYDYSGCGYIKPVSFSTERILDDAIEGERCAIRVYSKIAKMINGKDTKTYKIVSEILNDEKEHEEDLLKIKSLFKKQY